MVKNNIYSNNSNMIKKDLKKLTKSQLINMLLKKNEPKKVDKPKKENLEFLFDDNPFPKYLTKKSSIDKTMEKIKKMDRKLKSEINKTTKMFKRMINPISGIEEKEKALKGYTKS